MSSALSTIFKRYPRAKQVASRLFAMMPPRLRLGKSFLQWFAFYRASEEWDEQQHTNYQLDRLRTLLTELKASSPFYRERLEGVKVDAIQSVADFTHAVPLLDRETFRNNFQRILNQNRRSADCIPCATSGTTGTALKFYHAREDKGREWASICHQWIRVGFDPLHSIRAEFRGLASAPGAVDVYPHENMIRVDILNLNPANVARYAAAITKYGVRFYHGYPSAIAETAGIITRHKIPFPSPRAILLASEMIYDWQLDAIKAAFPDATIYAHYGCAERTVLGGWCETRHEYHCIPAYAFVEADAKTGELIGTNLYNSINGFVRYRMTDVATAISHDACPSCGRAYTPRILALDGRAADYLYIKGRGLFPPALITYLFRDLAAITYSQIHQEREDQLTIHFVAHPDASDSALAVDQEKIRRGFENLGGEAMTISFLRRDEIPRSPSGKFKWVVSHLASSGGS